MAVTLAPPFAVRHLPPRTQARVSTNRHAVRAPYRSDRRPAGHAGSLLSAIRPHGRISWAQKIGRGRILWAKQACS